jgi:hypothetical protein
MELNPHTTTVPGWVATPLSTEMLLRQSELEAVSERLVQRFGWLKAQRMLQDARTRCRESKGEVAMLEAIAIVEAEHEGDGCSG